MKYIESSKFETSRFEARILDDIRTGRLKPGERLPSTADLAAQSGADLREVQEALASLAARGLLDRKPRAGTFVKATPKVLKAAFLTGWNLESEPCHMPRLLLRHLRSELAARGYELQVIHDLFAGMVNDYGDFKRSAARLQNELRKADPCGLIEFQFSLKRVSDVHPEFDLPTIHWGRLEFGADVGSDRADFVEAALKHLAGLGRRKVLLIRKGGLVDPFSHEDATFWKGVKREKFLRGQLREVFVRSHSLNVEEAALALTESLIEEWRTARRNYIPDCLVVADDIMMRGVATALLKSRINVPEELTVVLLANEGIHHHYGLPVIRYEWPLKEIAARLAELFDQRVRRQRGRKAAVRISGRIVPPGEAAAVSANQLLEPLFEG